MSYLIVLSCFALSSASPSADLQRARSKVPRDAFRGHGFGGMSKVLTKHLRSSLPAESVRDCNNFGLDQLRRIQTDLALVAEPDLLAIYNSSQDNRRERHSSVAAMQAYWDELVSHAPTNTLSVLRDALCHDVVMRFVHHTSEKTRQRLAATPNFVCPTLPTQSHEHDGDAASLSVFKEYTAASGCQACHSRLVPLPKPAPMVDCEKQLVANCFKRGQLHKDACNACVANHSSNLNSCSNQTLTAWCDHPPACIGADECPVWPAEFSAPFTLHATIPPINGAKCNFYYKYTAEAQVQTVDYYEKCFPFVNARTAFNNLPCKLFFKPAGIYLSQPGRVDCCKFVDGVGAVPPEFLQSYTYKGSEGAPDMYGNTVQCDRWDGPSGFKYWTVGHHDRLYKNFGHDIVFQDGPTGVTWRWGNFTVEPQSESLFELPNRDCERSCPKFLTASDMQSLLEDSHVRRAISHSKVAQRPLSSILV